MFRLWLSRWDPQWYLCFKRLFRNHAMAKQFRILNYVSETMIKLKLEKPLADGINIALLLFQFAINFMFSLLTPILICMQQKGCCENIMCSQLQTHEILFSFTINKIW